MEELSQQANQKRNGLLDVFLIVGVLSGIIFDISDLYIKTSFESWSDIHYSLDDLQYLALSILAFSLCTYSNIKLKAFLFMYSVWRLFILVYNVYIPYFNHQYAMIPPAVIYFIWLYRTLTISTKKHKRKSLEDIDSKKAYNILFPVSTFRGLMQSIFTWKNPRYETRMLIHMNNLYLVYNNTFTCKNYEKDKLEELINKSGAVIKSKGVPSKNKINRVYNLVGSRSILGIRDCRRLEI